MLAAEFSATDIWILLAIIVLMLGLGYLAVAETALNRISKVKAATLAEEEPSKATAALVSLVQHPERFINPLLVMITILQTGQAFLTTILADRLFGPIGVLVGFVVNVIVFFVLSEALPKTWAVLHSRAGGAADGPHDARSRVVPAAARSSRVA